MCVPAPRYMMVKEFLALAPGTAALEGAVVLDPDTKFVGRVTAPHELVNSHLTGSRPTLLWEIIDLPLLYKDPKSRYCGWCKEKLGLGYTTQYGLEEGCCPIHGRAVPVLHKDDPKKEEPKPDLKSENAVVPGGSFQEQATRLSAGGPTACETFTLGGGPSSSTVVSSIVVYSSPSSSISFASVSGTSSVTVSSSAPIDLSKCCGLPEGSIQICPFCFYPLAAGHVCNN